MKDKGRATPSSIQFCLKYNISYILFGKENNLKNYFSKSLLQD